MASGIGIDYAKKKHSQVGQHPISETALAAQFAAQAFKMTVAPSERRPFRAKPTGALGQRLGSTAS